MTPCRMGKWREWGVCALLIGGTLLLFSRAITHGFVNYDDPLYVTENPQVQQGLSWAGLRWAMSASVFSWHPLTWLSHSADWHLYGANASGHHLTSVLLHAANAVLVWLLFRRLGCGLLLSAFAAALFAWHPLRVESVAWVSERKDVLSGLFFLLGVLAHLRYARLRDEGKRWGASYALVLVCLAAGLMSKPIVVALPAVLLVLDVWPLRRIDSAARVRTVVLEKIPLVLLAAIISALTLVAQQRSGAFVLDLTWGERVGNAFVAVARYLRSFAWPVDLVVCYPHPGRWPIAAYLGGGALVALCSVLAWRQRFARPWLAAGWLWFLVTLLPVLGLVQVGYQSMADRYTYLPMLGIEIALLCTWRPVAASSRARLAACLAAAGVLVACVMATWRQQAVWHDSVALFSHAVRVDPDNAVAHGFLASALFAQSRLDEATAHAERACALDDRNETARLTLAGIREAQGRLDDAAELLRAALALRPDNRDAQCQLGLVELRRGRIELARELIEPALRHSPARVERTRELGDNALRVGDRFLAAFHYGVVLSVAPGNAEAHAGMAAVLLARGDASAAIAHLREAVALRPDLAHVQLALAQCATQLGYLDEASAAISRALDAAPEDAALQVAVGDWYARRGDTREAERRYRRALELAPNYPGLRERLAGGVADR